MVTKSNDLSYTFLEAFLKSVIPLAKQNKGWEDAPTGSRYTIFLSVKFWNKHLVVAMGRGNLASF